MQWFDGKAQEAGYLNGLTGISKLSKDLGIDPWVLRKYVMRQLRPSWGAVQAIASRLRQPVIDVVQILWDEAPGDPCPCGCDGVKAEPATPLSRSLPIRRRCRICGELGPISGTKHRSYCRRHARVEYNATARKAELELRCRGYGKFITEFAAECERKVVLTRRQASARARTERVEFGVSAIDIEQGFYQCKACSLSASPSVSKAVVEGDPPVVGLKASKSSPVVLTCIGYEEGTKHAELCRGAIRVTDFNVLRRIQESQTTGSASSSSDLNKGTYRCAACSKAAVHLKRPKRARRPIP
jgi:hypothetical protein